MIIVDHDWCLSQLGSVRRTNIKYPGIAVKTGCRFETNLLIGTPSRAPFKTRHPQNMATQLLGSTIQEP